MEKLKHFMGLEAVVFDDIFANLHFQGFIQKNPTLHLTEAGKNTLATLEKSECIFEQVHAFIDGVTGKIIIKGNILGSKDRTIEQIKPLVKYPRTENLESFYTIEENITLYKALFDSLKNFFSKGKQKKQNKKKSKVPKQELIEISEILDQPRKINQKIWLLFFRHYEQGDDRILVLEDNLQINSRMTEFINEQEGKGTKVISLSKPKDEKLLPENKINRQKIETINDIDKLPTGTTISTYSHPIVLEKTLKEATSRILINSPWITQQVIDASFKTDLENALKRQVYVTIIYGFGGGKTGKSDIDQKTEKYFRDLKKRHKEHIFIKETKGNHAKVIICDDKFMVVTSFNWLSFKGDKSRPLRTEYGTIIKNQEEIAKMRQELEAI